MSKAGELMLGDFFKCMQRLALPPDEPDSTARPAVRGRARWWVRFADFRRAFDGHVRLGCTEDSTTGGDSRPRRPVGSFCDFSSGSMVRLEFVATRIRRPAAIRGRTGWRVRFADFVRRTPAATTDYRRVLRPALRSPLSTIRRTEEKSCINFLGFLGERADRRRMGGS